MMPLGICKLMKIHSNIDHTNIAFNLQCHVKITTCISKQSVDFLDMTISMNEDFY